VLPVVRVLVAAREWLEDFEREAGPVQRVSNLGLMPDGRGWYARLRFHADGQQAELGVMVGAGGRWRQLEPEPGELRAVLRFHADGEQAEGLLLDTLQSTQSVRITPDGDRLRLQSGEFRARARP
jgi:hypothetical protein